MENELAVRVGVGVGSKGEMIWRVSTERQRKILPTTSPSRTRMTYGFEPPLERWNRGRRGRISIIEGFPSGSRRGTWSDGDFSICYLLADGDHLLGIKDSDFITGYTLHQQVGDLEGFTTFAGPS